jgi:diguanylate cyclase (GGDEF)-like protein/PAS domain S-box-containing protein
VALGLKGLAGWLLHVPTLVAFQPGQLPMVFNTALCFSLAGSALYLSQRPGGLARQLRTALGGSLIALCGATLAEYWFNRGFGIDLGFLHTWYDYGNSRPGRMAPNTAIGFCVIGSAIVLMDRVTTKPRAITVVVLTYGVLTIGLTGLIGHVLSPDLLFEWSRSARMALDTAAGMILCSLVLWLTWTKREWYASQTYLREEEKIRLLAPAGLVVVTIIAGLSGFVLLQSAFQESRSRELETVLHDRATLFTTSIDQALRDSLTAVHLSGLEGASRAALSAVIHGSDTSAFDAAASGLIGELSGIALWDTSGRLRQTAGRPSAEAVISAPLNRAEPAGAPWSELLWDGELILRMHLPLMQEGRLAGDIVVDRPLAALYRALFDTASLGATGEVAVCVLDRGDLSCLPGRLHPSAYTVHPAGGRSPRLPMQYAIAGQSGSIAAIDYRGRNVIAAFGLLAPGLGIVVKQDAVELYAVIRDALRIGGALMALIALFGALFLHFQVKPLAVRMRESESAAIEKEQQIRMLVECVGEGILLLDARGLIHEANPAASDIFGYDTAELIGQNAALLMPAEGQPATYGRLSLQAGPALLAGKRNIKVTGRKKCGAEFSLELSINELGSSNGRLFVAIMRDITERNEAERRLTVLGHYDSLTGLPNRALFLDRLNLAGMRTARSGRALALMYLDLDGFKEVNDRFGHQSGDELLVQVAQRLSANVRRTDTVARLGGDEFTIILEGLSLPSEHALSMGQKIVAAMQVPFSLSGGEASVTTSMGLVIHESGELRIAQFLASADEAMYAAKRAGKNRISVG